MLVHQTAMQVRKNALIDPSPLVSNPQGSNYGFPSVAV
jgi:hypothetical protein